MTAFKVGEFVISRINAQGLTQGNLYEVVDVVERHLAFGTFVTYVLQDDNENRFAVSNGHLVLDRVAVTA
jgi:hypothetical protein